MKTLKIFSITSSIFPAVVLSLPKDSFAQKTTTETLNVSGECGMCKKKIEKAAKAAGASYAVWSTTTKVLTVKYNSLSTNSAKIQQKIADAGYDTPKFKSTDEAYNDLDECCQYNRTMSKDEKCCSEQCEMSSGSGGKDGKCMNEAACKEKGCCKDSEKCKEMGCCGNEKGMANAKMPARMTGSDGACCSKGKGMADSKMPARTTGSDGNCCSKEKGATNSSEKQHH